MKISDENTFYNSTDHGKRETALRLLVAKKIIEEHQGILEIGHDQEQKTKISIYLPMIE